LPGMRFQKDGALKPGFSPPSLKSGLDIHVDLTGAGQLCFLPKATLGAFADSFDNT
jgi:hypothetical protein